MKKHFIILLCLSFLLLPVMKVNAQDYTLKQGKIKKGTYNETDYNYYKIKPPKSGFLEIKAKTSNGTALKIDICDENKEVTATDIWIKNKKSVLHKAKKGQIYYLRIKGKEDITYQISYKIKKIDELTYAEKYNYTFTNESFWNQDNAIVLKVKTNKSGILNFMNHVNDTVLVKYLSSNKKEISKNYSVSDYNLTGIGVEAQKTYYIKLWKPDNIKDGTTTFSNLKYQIKEVSSSNYNSKSNAKKLNYDEYANTVVAAGKKHTAWYKVNITEKKKLSITIESRMLQNNGKHLRLYICNENGKKINTSPIVIDKVSHAKYKKKKYIMVYPTTTLKTTSAFPAGTYYLKVESNTKTSSGAYRIKWK